MPLANQVQSLLIGQGKHSRHFNINFLFGESRSMVSFCFCFFFLLWSPCCKIHSCKCFLFHVPCNCPFFSQSRASFFENKRGNTSSKGSNQPQYCNVSSTYLARKLCLMLFFVVLCVYDNLNAVKLLLHSTL